jgi:hypothetical protein
MLNEKAPSRFSFDLGLLLAKFYLWLKALLRSKVPFADNYYVKR